MKIATKAAIVFVAVGLLPLGGVSLFGFERLRTLALERAHGEMRGEATRMAEAVDRWMDDNRRMITVLARNPQIIEAARTRAAAESVPVLRDFNQAYPWHTVVFLSDATGQQIARSDDVRLVNMGQRGPAVRVLQKGEAYADAAVIGTADGVPSVLFAAAVKAPVDGTLLGLAGARSTVGDLTRIVTPRGDDRADGVFAMLATADGEALVHSGFLADQQRSNVIRNAPEFGAAAATTGVVGFDGAGGRMLGYSARTARGWVLLYALPADAVLAPVRQAALVFAATCVLALAAFALIAWKASRTISQPIEQLAAVAERVSRGHLDDVALAGLEQRRDEIGNLAQAVSRLVISFKAAMGMLRKRPAA